MNKTQLKILYFMQIFNRITAAAAVELPKPFSATNVRNWKPTAVQQTCTMRRCCCCYEIWYEKYEKTIKTIKLIENDRSLFCALKKSESPQIWKFGYKTETEYKLRLNLILSPCLGGLGKLPEHFSCKFSLTVA